jgi:hypothetical protein
VPGVSEPLRRQDGPGALTAFGYCVIVGPRLLIIGLLLLPFAFG